MRNPSKFAIQLAAAGSLTLLITTSSFADTRPQDRSWRNSGDQTTQTQTASSDHEGRDRAATRERHRQQSSDSSTATTTQRETSRTSGDRTWDRNAGATGNVDRSQNRQNFDRSAAQNFDRGAGTQNLDRRDTAQSSDRRGSDNRGSDRANRDSRDSGRGNQSRREEARAIAHDYRNSRGSSRYDNYRDNGRVADIGTIRSFSRERDGYRVFFDRSPYSYWVPFSSLGRHQLRVGLGLRLGGIFRNGAIFVDVLGWPGDPYYNDPYYNDVYSNGGYYDDGGYGRDVVRGTVDRVDYRTGTVWLVDDIHRSLITVDMRSIDRRYSRLNLDDLRRGDRITVAGSWLRGGYFAAERIASIDSY